MNIQEAIDAICNLKTNDGLVSRYAVVSIVNQIEPQKPVIPQFVAEWIEEAKEGECSLCTAFGLVDGDSRNFDWLFNGDKSNQETFARAWLDGYEIEQEQLYTVEIPDPNVDEYSIVLGRKEGKVQIKQTLSTTWQMNCSNQLTESEIKEDFEWAWDAGFAKKVED